MKSSYSGVAVPSNGKTIVYSDGVFRVPDQPIVPFIEGDGTGRDIWKASRRVFDAAVEKAYGGKRRIGMPPGFCIFAVRFHTAPENPDDAACLIELDNHIRALVDGPNVVVLIDS